MKPGKLFNRDYLYLTSDEQATLDAYQRWQDMPDLKAGIPELPVAVRRHRSLFPNNYIGLRAMKEEGDLCTLNDGFERLINSPGCHEQQILNYINRTPAYHIVGSLLRNRYSFGHHSLFLFKEMSLGHDFRTDYVLIGSGSGGFECVLVEFEGPEGRIITKGGYLGQVIRDGKNQVEDWKCWMDANYNLFSADLQTVINPKMELPEELIRYSV